MTKLIKFHASAATLKEPHAGGGCNLSPAIEWPRDANGKPLVHLLTMPISWFGISSARWISIFTPFNADDEFQHWELLTDSPKNTSCIICHDNSGEGGLRDPVLQSIALKIELLENAAIDTSSFFASKISTNIAWLQDRERIENLDCGLMLDGDDFDLSFGSSCGIFSGGYLYAFLDFNSCEIGAGPIVGRVTFQFS